MSRKKNKYPPFVALPRETIKGDQWKSLSSSARTLYIQIKYKYVGDNNGQIQLHYVELKGLNGFKSPATVSRAFKELETGGWIEKTKHGGLYRFVNNYRLTGKFDRALNNYGF